MTGNMKDPPKLGPRDLEAIGERTLGHDNGSAEGTRDHDVRQNIDALLRNLEHYYRPPGLPREQQPWLASVWRAVT